MEAVRLASVAQAIVGVFSFRAGARGNTNQLLRCVGDGPPRDRSQGSCWRRIHPDHPPRHSQPHCEDLRTNLRKAPRAASVHSPRPSANAWAGAREEGGLRVRVRVCSCSHVFLCSCWFIHVDYHTNGKHGNKLTIDRSVWEPHCYVATGRGEAYPSFMSRVDRTRCRIRGKATRGAVRNKKRWKGRRAPTQDPGTGGQARQTMRQRVIGTPHSVGPPSLGSERFVSVRESVSTKHGSSKIYINYKARFATIIVTHDV